MYKIHEIREIIKLVDESSIQHIEIENGESKVSIKRNNSLILGNDRSLSSQSINSKIEVLPEREGSNDHKPTIQFHKGEVESVEKKVLPNEVSSENHTKIISPMVGTFYAAPAEGEPSYVHKGDQVDESTVVCILEAMKLFNEIEAEIKGEIVEILVKNGQLVEFGQPLFLVKQTS
ncbi:acetyl-CoA carboxylase biotin carboxyl carrier protein [Bacillus sp. AFS088145]|uniref:acetyl-CoA carboxylase biotin carboxyl carrier protein n=1 Tax=Bacillus sp. AFS088145 TaxID=2033514 RepID=UPI000BF53C07|nr:acetyl-CoA carboxylase biotin carboxyl carrier protein [Bacillus sp. AFS088145]PFH87793.1 acetyl-CoA carboxylase, biotin carboxyl carrier protein [Bacillus sp. AFS088145]